MKKKDIRRLVREKIQELSTTGGGASFSPGEGAQYAFVKKNTKKNKATKYGEKLGYKTVNRPSRPSHTKLFDYLQ